MTAIKLKAEIVDEFELKEGIDYHDVTALLLYSKDEPVTDMNRNRVMVDRETIKTIEMLYNQRVDIEREKLSERAKRIFGKDEILIAPVYLDHKENERSKVGRVLNKFWTEEKNGQLYLYGKLRILLKENVERVRTSLYKNLSSGFNLRTKHFDEVSFTEDPVFEEAGVVQFSKPKENLLKFAHQYIENGKKLDKLKNDYTATCDVIKLMKKGKVYPRDIKRVVADLALIKHPDDKKVAFRMLSNLPNVIDFNIYNRNLGAKKLEEMLLMSDDDRKGAIKSIETTVAKIRAKFSKDAKAPEAEKIITPAANQADKVKLAEGIEQKSMEDWKRCKEMCETGKHAELKSFIEGKMSEYDEKEGDGEKEEVAMSRHVKELKEEIIKLAKGQEDLRTEFKNEIIKFSKIGNTEALEKFNELIEKLNKDEGAK